MRAYLIELVKARAADLQAGILGTDMVSRLLVLAEAKALRFDVPQVVLNVGGLLIGGIETTSHAVVNTLLALSDDPERQAAAVKAAHDPDITALDGFVFEALRFKPAFPYFFRMAEDHTVLARGTDHETAIPKRKMVLAVTHSAMFDPAAVTEPNRFDPTRGLNATFTFGYGIHECLGRAVGAAVVPAIVRAILRRHDLRRGAVDYRNGPVPEAWPWFV
jgi:cytochrome P450